MEATVVKLNGLLQDSKVIMGGVSFLNPDNLFYDAGPILTVFARVPNIQDDTKDLIIKSYGGPLGTTSAEFDIIDTKVIGGSVVKTYKTTFTNGSGIYTDPNTGDVYAERLVRMKDSNSIPWRVDIMGEDIDVFLPGTSTTGFDFPLVVDAEQLKYSTIPSECRILKVTNLTGTLKTEWFRNNTNLINITLRGHVDLQGTIMDFVSAGKTLSQMNFVSRNGLKGVMTEFLDALKESGVVNKVIEFHLTSCGITNDVYIEDTEEHKPIPTFYVKFDSNGDYKGYKNRPQ